ncbi:MAG: flagellar hook-associated protein, partial [Ghiorsea sp.]|nr:flagellar hook-associated protein [Ghiorsea sp.]
EAISSGNTVTIQHSSYGINNGFSVAGAIALGISDTGATPILGSNVAGTINGETATANGQVLVGNAGSADGIGILYQGTATTPFTANLTVGMGAAASFQGTLDLYANPFSGFFQNSIQSSEQTFLSIDEHITSLELQMEKKRTTLSRSFLAMEQAMNSLNATGSYLTEQAQALNGNN